MESTTPTSAVTILSSVHGRQRRQERDISKKDLQAAIRYGKKEATLSQRGEHCWKYTFADIVYLTDYTSTKEITSWPLQCCGIDLKKKDITPQMLEAHEKSIQTLQDTSLWTSHTVAMVDQSGSMRKNDTSERVTRSDLVWLLLALDYVSKRIQSGEAKDTDIFTLISMQSRSNRLLKYRPTDWILYNDLVDLLRTAQPLGDGNYLPSLDSAEAVLNRNQYSNCALLLLFLSDGRPSDRLKSGQTGSDMISKLQHLTKNRIGRLASKFGRRLTIGCIALGNESTNDKEFSILRGISETAEEYGCLSYFKEASLSVTHLADAFSKLSAFVTSTKSELTDITSMKQKPVKSVVRETINDLGAKKIESGLWYLVTNNNTQYGKRNVTKTRWIKGSGWYASHDSRLYISEKAVGIAVKKRIFGEGAERMVREFREYDKNRNLVGPPMVAKESRFVEENATDKSRDKKDFHKVFCKTQLLAQRFARVFNERMVARYGQEVPTIQFLKCSVYMLKIPGVSGRQGFLVEQMLDVKTFKYTKWNSNDGYVHGNNKRNEKMGPTHDDDWSAKVDSKDILYAIAEESDSNSLSSVSTNEDDDKVDQLLDDQEQNMDRIQGKRYDPESHSFWEKREINKDYDFNIEDVPQAFSCFSYKYSRRKCIVCDLQGIYNHSRNPPAFELTDPVIHYKSSRQRNHVYGRTDKGEDGIHDFFKTHVCSNLCNIIDRRLLDFHYRSVFQAGHKNEYGTQNEKQFI